MKKKMKLNFYWDWILFRKITFMCRPNLIYSLILAIFYLKCNTLYLLDGDDITGYTNRPVYTMNNPNTYEERHYFPYHPGWVETTHEYRVELDATQNPAELDNSEIPRGFNKYKRIDNPAHYPKENSTLLGTVHSSKNESYQIGEISPTRSEVEGNGVYFGNHINNNLRRPVPKSSLGNRILNKLNKWEDKIRERTIQGNETLRREDEVLSILKNSKKKHYISSKELHDLNKLGYTLKKR